MLGSGQNASRSWPKRTEPSNVACSNCEGLTQTAKVSGSSRSRFFLGLPSIVKVILGGAAVAAVVAVLHPRSRQTLMQWTKGIRERLREVKPELVSFSQRAVKYLAEEAKTSKTTLETIQSRLRVRGKQTALPYVRLICLRSKEPLSAGEIARRVLASGYSSRSKNFAAYVRRVLKQDGRFIGNADGLWMLRAVA